MRGGERVSVCVFLFAFLACGLSGPLEIYILELFQGVSVGRPGGQTIAQ